VATSTLVARLLASPKGAPHRDRERAFGLAPQDARVAITNMTGAITIAL
jgi:hypothetical protein